MKSRPFALNLTACMLIGLANVAPVVAAEGYVTSGQTPDQPVRSGFGECVHTYAWTPGMSFADCELAPAPAPSPAALPEPVPQPVVEAPKAEPVLQNLSFELLTDTFFDFDKSTLRLEGRAALDDVATRLAGTNYSTITIVGHADRIGGRQYNQALSERRAQAIRDYLVSKGIAGDKIVALGVGSSEPTVQCSHLRGARLIACLQPDRYAELTVSGTTTMAAQ